MIKLENLKITNFLSFKKLELKFERGLFLLEGYNFDENTSNGSGKSSIIDAICFALYGDLPRKVKFEDVITWGESSLDMQITFNKGKTHYFVHRARNPNLLNFYVDANLKNGKDNRETQQIINKALGLSLDTFLRSIYFSQNTDIVTQFLFSNDEERKDVLTELLDLYVFDKCFEMVKTDATKLNEKRTELAKEISYLQRQTNEKKEEEKRLKVSSESFESVRQENIRSVKTDIKRLEEDKKKIKTEYNQQLKLVEGIEKNQLKIGELETLIDNNLDNNLTDLKIRQGSNDREIKLLKIQLKEYNELVSKGKCPTCLQDIGSGCFDNATKDISVKINKLETLGNSYLNDRSETEKKVAKNDADKKEIVLLRSKVIASQTILKNAHSSYTQNISNLDKHILSYQKQLEQKEKEVNNSGVLLKECSEKIESFKLDIDTRNKENSKLDKYLGVYTYLTKAFGKEGVKAFVFAKIINEINYYVADYLRQMFDGNISLQFNIQSLDSQGNTKQKMDTILTINGERRNINILSGGEKAKLLLATNFALSKIIATRCPSMPNFLCLDEVLTGLDDSGKIKMMEFLRKLSFDKDFIFVVDHQTEFKSAFDGIYNIEKRNGISEIVNV